MALPMEEQEVTIGFNRSEQNCTLYASDRTFITRMEKLCRRNPEQFRKVSETEWGCTYEFPKQFLSIRSKDVKHNLTEEQREARSVQAARRFRKQ